MALLSAGCADGAQNTQKEEQGMRSALQDKGTFDINKVPAEQRDKVKAMMGGSGGSAPKPASKP